MEDPTSILKKLAAKNSSPQPVEAKLHQLPLSWWERVINLGRRLAGRPLLRRYAVRLQAPLVIPPGETRSVLLRLPSSDRPSDE